MAGINIVVFEITISYIHAVILLRCDLRMRSLQKCLNSLNSLILQNVSFDRQRYFKEYRIR